MPECPHAELPIDAATWVKYENVPPTTRATLSLANHVIAAAGPSVSKPRGAKELIKCRLAHGSDTCQV